MIRENFNKTNNQISDAMVQEVETVLGIEITKTYNLLPHDQRIRVDPDNGYNIPYNGFRNLSFKVKNVSFDKETKVFSYDYRGKWQRSFQTKKVQLEIIGYKLPTTSLMAGYIYGIKK